MSGRRGLHARIDKRTQLILVILVAVVGGFLGGSIIASNLAIDPSSKGQLPSEEPEKRVSADPATVVSATSANQYGIPSKLPSDTRISFLILGYGGGGHEGAYLTDSTMLAVADPGKKTLTLLSLPRDSWVPLQFDGKTASYSKLNTAYALAKDAGLYRSRLARYVGSRGAGNFAKDTVARVLGVPIENYVGLDFQGFREMIDTVGGVDVKVPSSFSARYPANDDPSIDPSWIIVRFTEGVEHMGGERAIRFARAREAISNPNEGSDFARSRRQRIIMEAFKTRLLSPGGLIHFPQILGVMTKHVDTDYAITDVSYLSQFLLEWKDVHIYQTALTPENYLRPATGPSGAYVLAPSAPDHTWAQVRAFARRLWQDPATGVSIADTKVVVVNDTGVEGLATQLTEVLSKLGYNVGTPVPGQLQAESRLVDRTGGKADLVVGQLERDLGIHFQETAKASGGSSGELVLHLGSNNKSLTNLVVPADSAAPSGAPGIENFGGWSPEIAPSTPEKQVSPTANPIGQPTNVPKGTPPAGSIATPQRTPAPPSVGTPKIGTATPTVTPPTPTAKKTPSPSSQPGPTRTP